MGRTLSNDAEFEMYGTVITANGKRERLDVDNESEENILPLQNPGILKTTQVNISINDTHPNRYYGDEKV